MTRILVVDNFDSFVYTLAGYLQELGAEVEVVRNDRVDASDIAEWDAVLLSPGPGAPGDAGASIPMVHAAIATRTPLLGVCLGHQAIAEALGGIVTHAPELMHGKTSLIEHDDSMVFAGLPSPLTATRYHSLAIVDGTLPSVLRVTARTALADAVLAQGVGGADASRDAGAQAQGVIMAVEHREAPVWGVQFHPESVLTEGGYRMLGNWLAAAGLPEAAETAKGLTPLVRL